MSAFHSFIFDRELWIRPLQMLLSILDRKAQNPALAHVAVCQQGDRLCLTATDGELELRTWVPWEGGHQGRLFEAMTLPGRKVYDVLRSLPSGTLLSCEPGSDRLVFSSQHCRFEMQTLPYTMFPSSLPVEPICTFEIEAKDFHYLLERSVYATAHHENRPYFTGVLFESEDQDLRMVGADGHRLAMAFLHSESSITQMKALIPRKTVLELLRLMGSSPSKTFQIGFSETDCCIEHEDFRMLSRLIASKYPNYLPVFPKQPDRQIFLSREEGKQALQRVMILMEGEDKSVTLRLGPQGVEFSSVNAHQECASEQVSCDYSGEPIALVYNGTYLLEAFSHIQSEQMVLKMSGQKSGLEISDGDRRLGSRHVVMPVHV